MLGIAISIWQTLLGGSSGAAVEDTLLIEGDKSGYLLLEGDQIGALLFEGSH